MAAKVESCRAAEHDILAMLAMTMEATPTVSEEEDVRQQAEAQDDTEAVEAMEVQEQCHWRHTVNEGLLFVPYPP